MKKTVIFVDMVALTKIRIRDVEVKLLNGRSAGTFFM